MHTTHRLRWASVIVVMLLLVAAHGSSAGVGSAFRRRDATSIELGETMARVGSRVEAFFSRAQSLICTETVTVQPLSQGLTRDGFGRTIESELHLSWETSDGPPDATVQARRNVISVNRRAPKLNDPNNCTTPEQQDTEPQPLSMLLPEHQSEYEFSRGNAARLDGRPAVTVDFRQVTPVSVDVQVAPHNEDCVSYELNGGLRGRLWLDAETLDVLRLDQHLSGMIDVRLPKALLKRQPSAEASWTLERWDNSIRFGRIAFTDPDETLVLPLSASTMRITRGAGTPRLRTETKYANYKRFLTGGRIVGDERR